MTVSYRCVKDINLHIMDYYGSKALNDHTKEQSLKQGLEIAQPSFKNRNIIIGFPIGIVQ